MVLSMTGVSSVTAVQWYQYFQDICSWKLVNSPTSLGGSGKIVQIDESMMVKAKYHRGHQLRAKQCWVFEQTGCGDVASHHPAYRRFRNHDLVGRVCRARSAVVAGLCARNSQPLAPLQTQACARITLRPTGTPSNGVSSRW